MDDDTNRDERWKEFVGTLDAAVVLAFLTDDAERESPAYFKNLIPRINEAFIDCQVGFGESGGDYEPDPDIYLLELAADLENDAPPEDVAYTARALSAIAVHSALESYAEAIIGRGFGPLPKRLREQVEAFRVPEPDHLFHALVEFDATRHILVHNRGIVDRRYIDQVPSSAWRIGQKRPLPLEQLVRYVHVALQCGDRIRHSGRGAQ